MVFGIYLVVRTVSIGFCLVSSPIIKVARFAPGWVCGHGVFELGDISGHLRAPRRGADCGPRVPGVCEAHYPRLLKVEAFGLKATDV